LYDIYFNNNDNNNIKYKLMSNVKQYIKYDIILSDNRVSNITQKR